MSFVACPRCCKSNHFSCGQHISMSKSLHFVLECYSKHCLWAHECWQKIFFAPKGQSPCLQCWLCQRQSLLTQHNYLPPFCQLHRRWCPNNCLLWAKFLPNILDRFSSLFFLQVQSHYNLRIFAMSKICAIFFYKIWQYFTKFDKANIFKMFACVFKHMF